MRVNYFLIWIEEEDDSLVTVQKITISLCRIYGRRKGALTFKVKPTKF
jgi:hypothetical protein